MWEILAEVYQNNIPLWFITVALLYVPVLNIVGIYFSQRKQFEDKYLHYAYLLIASGMTIGFIQTREAFDLLAALLGGFMFMSAESTNRTVARIETFYKDLTSKLR